MLFVKVKPSKGHLLGIAGLIGVKRRMHQLDTGLAGSNNPLRAFRPATPASAHSGLVKESTSKW